MIDRKHSLPLARQAALLRLSRSSLYYQPQSVPEAELVVMRRIDALHLDYPFAGSRMLRDLLRGEGIDIGRERVRTMMRRMCIEALYRRPNTSKAAPGHKIYPYLLRGAAVERPNQVWAMDVTYPDGTRLRLPRGRRGLVYPAGSGLAAVDHHGGGFLHRRGPRKRSQSMAGPRFSTPIRAASSPAPNFTGLLLENKIAISMDGRGSERDNVFDERLWRSVKYEEVDEVYLRGLRQRRKRPRLARRVSGFRNALRPHSSLDARTPDHAYFNHQRNGRAA